MRLANLDRRPVLVTGPVTAGRVATVEIDTAPGFGTSFDELFKRWDQLREWADTVDLEGAAANTVDLARLGPPSPNPRQVFAIGLNYAAHAAESGLPTPEYPTTFTKFPTCISGPFTTVELPSDSVDYEIELVVVIGRHTHRVTAGSAWSHVAGLMVGQDLSERVVQLRPPAPQFSLGKSFPGFGPTGPWLVTPDELANADDLAVSCRLNGELVQSSRTSDLIFSVSTIVEYVSTITPMLPGDLVFTGTPAGVGMGRVPPRYLRPGDVLESTIDQIGTITTKFH